MPRMARRFQDALMALGCRWSPIWAGGDDGGTGCMDVKIDSGGYDEDPVGVPFSDDWIEVWAYVKEGDNLSVVAKIRYDDPNFIRDLLAAVAGDFIQPNSEKENEDA